MPNPADKDGRAADLAAVRAVAAGDREAFARLIDRESPKLLRLTTGILGNLEEAEDVVQEAMISLWEHAPRWTPEARIGTWLHTVCLNRSIDRLRRRRPAAETSALSDLADGAAPADVAMMRSETVRTVREAIDRLPERQRSAVLLFHIQDLPQSEAARVMGVSEGAFESLLARARRGMRRMLAAGEGEDE